MTEPQIEPTAELNCRGMLCPQPVIELHRHITDVPVGAVIAVVSDDAAAAVDIPAWCRMRVQEYLGTAVAADGCAVYLVRRTAPGG
jgi:tRNA 2-thiouridine synthesizing protein A